MLILLLLPALYTLRRQHPGLVGTMDMERYELSGLDEPVYLLSLGKKLPLINRLPQTTGDLGLHGTVLDGGGVRGISEAVILHEIMTRVQRELGLERLPKPCDYFHLIGGTSTGGYGDAYCLVPREKPSDVA